MKNCRVCVNERSSGSDLMEVLYHIRPYFVGIFPYIALTLALYMVGTSNLGNGRWLWCIHTYVYIYIYIMSITGVLYKQNHPANPVPCQENHGKKWRDPIPKIRNQVFQGRTTRHSRSLSLFVGKMTVSTMISGPHMTTYTKKKTAATELRSGVVYGWSSNMGVFIPPSPSRSKPRRWHFAFALQATKKWPQKQQELLPWEFGTTAMP